MASHRQRTAGLAATVVVKILKAAFALPDKAIARLLTGVEWILRKTGKRPEDHLPLTEIREIFQNSPKDAAILRTVITGARNDQFVSTVRGVLLHHATAGLPPGTVSTTPVDEVRPLRILLAGHGDILGLWEDACVRRGHQPIALAKDAGDLPLDEVEAVEIGPWQTNARALAWEALGAGMPVSIHPSALRGSEEYRGLLSLSTQTRASLRLSHPALHYQPVRALLQKTSSGTLGEITMIRVRATIAGQGGTLAPVWPDENEYLRHEAFDHVILLAAIGGTIQSVSATLNPMTSDRGGQGIVLCKFQRPGLYGAIECTCAPALRAPSQTRPYVLSVEVTGTDGVVFANRGEAALTQEAPLTVRVGRNAYTLGIETGMTGQWTDVYDDLVSSWERTADPFSVSPAAALSALGAREKALIANRERKIIPVQREDFR